MDWGGNIVRCLMLATLVVAASAPVNAARPGLIGAWRGGGGYRIRTRDVYRPPAQNNGANTGGLGRVPGYGSASPSNAEFMRAVVKNNNQQIHPNLGYDIYLYRSKPGRSNMGTIGYSTRDTDYWKRVLNAESNAMAKPVTEAAFSKNNYQKSSYTNDHDESIRGTERFKKSWEKMMKAMKKDDHKSDQGESTTVKITTPNGNRYIAYYGKSVPLLELHPSNTNDYETIRKLKEEMLKFYIAKTRMNELPPEFRDT